MLLHLNIIPIYTHFEYSSFKKISPNKSLNTLSEGISKNSH